MIEVKILKKGKKTASSGASSGFAYGGYDRTGTAVGSLSETVTQLAAQAGAWMEMFAPVDTSGAEMTWDEAAANPDLVESIKARRNLFSEGYITAYGSNPDNGTASGGGGINFGDLADKGYMTQSEIAAWLLSGYGLGSSTIASLALKSDLSLYALKSDLSQYALKTAIPTKVSQLANDSGYITSAALAPYAKTADLPETLPASDVYAWAKAATKPTYSWSEIQSKPTNLVTTDTVQTISGLKTFSNGLKLKTDSYPNWTSSDRSIPFGTNGADLQIQWVNTDASKGLTYNPSTGALKAAQFVRRGGTSSQFLKADGSVDNTAYLPKSTYDTFKALFDTMFEVKDGAIHAKMSLWSDGFITAYGTNPDGTEASGGGGGLTVGDVQTILSNGKYVTESQLPDLTPYAKKTEIPATLKNPYKLTFGSKTYDGSAAVTLTAADLGALTSLPTASGSVKGGVRVGDGLSIVSEVLSVSLKAGHIPSLDIAKITGLQTALDGKAAKATTLAGYGITDAYTQGAVDTKVTALNTAIDGKVSLTANEAISGGKRFSNYVSLVGTGGATPTRLHTGVLSWRESGWDDVFAMWASFSGSGSAQSFFIGGGGTGTELAATEDSPALNPYVTIKHTTGNVGIGTTSPTTKLHVNGGITGTSLYAQYMELSGGTPFIDFHFNNSTADYTSRIIEAASGTLTLNNVLKVTLNGQTEVTKSLKIGECVITYENGALHFSKGLYSDGFITAYGTNPDGTAASGGGGIAWGDIQANLKTYYGLETGTLATLARKTEIPSLSGYATESWVSANFNKYVLTKAAVEAVLTGNITSHTHSQYLTAVSWGIISGKPNVNAPTKVGHLGWQTTMGQLATIDTLAFWNGRFNDSTSNLAYCNKGAFGDMATKNAADYLARSGGSMTNTNVVSNLNADLWDGEHLSAFRMKKYYTIDASSLPDTNFYPITVSASDLEWDCEIHSQNRSGSDPWNQNHMHFLLTAQGWSDTPKTFVILSRGAYQSAEITIGAVGYGNQQGALCVWVRGGNVYRLYSNRVPTLHTSDYTYGSEVYTVGTNYYGGVNTQITRLWTAENPNANCVAKLDSNVASATKLADNSSFKAWGQEFFANGVPKSVSGNMTDVGSITASGRNTVKGAFLAKSTSWASDNGHFRAQSSASEKPYAVGFGPSEDGYGIIQASQIGIGGINLLLNPLGGDVGIGTTSPANKLHVEGGIRGNNLYAQTLELSGNATVAMLIASGEIRSSNANAFRAAYGDYGCFLRNDGANTYLMLTAKGDPYGTWNDLKPVVINDATGNVTLGNVLGITNGGNVTATNELHAAKLVSSGNIEAAMKVTAQAIELSHATPYIDFHFGSSTADYTTRLIEEASGQLKLYGTLHATAGIYCDGYITAYTAASSSDARLKDVGGDINLPLEAVAAAPWKRFSWKADPTRRANAGGIAQYWLGVLPEVVRQTPDGMYSLEYGVLGYGIGVENSRRLLKAETELERLRRRVAELEAAMGIASP